MFHLLGDTFDSYAYDGNRQRRWNMATFKYGELWQNGDIISCLIDMKLGQISYLRNGRHLGIAFSDIKIGRDDTDKAIAYFPTISLALEENMIVNFGATPFQYPQEGFQPLCRPSIENTLISQQCLKWLEKLSALSLGWCKVRTNTMFKILFIKMFNI